MGIRGLTGFVDERSDRILVGRRLADEHLVIDGWNLCHWLYNAAYKLSTQFNGDYYDFTLAIQQFFGNLHMCGITPHVLLDASDPDPSRAAVQFFRAKDRINVGCRRNKRGSLTPILCEQVFVANLRRLSIPYKACVDADQRLASLAVRLNCLLLSNDSDFFIFDLPKGIAVLDYFDCRVQTCETTQMSFLHAEVFQRNNFVRFLLPQQLEQSVTDVGGEEVLVSRLAQLLPILAACIEYEEIFKILRSSHGARNSELCDGAVAAVFRVFYSTVLLPSSVDPWNYAVEQLSLRLKTPLRSEFNKAIEKARAFYTVSNVNNGDADLMTQNQKPNIDGSSQRPMLIDHLVEESKLSRMFCGDALVHRRVLLRCLFEETCLPSCYDKSRSARKTLYRLLFRHYFNKAGSEKTEENVDAVAVDEFSRIGYHFKAVQLPVLDGTIPPFIPSPTFNRAEFVDCCLLSSTDGDDLANDFNDCVLLSVCGNDRMLPVLANLRAILSSKGVNAKDGNARTVHNFHALFPSVTVAWYRSIFSGCLLESTVVESQVEGSFIANCFLASFCFCAAVVAVDAMPTAITANKTSDVRVDYDGTASLSSSLSAGDGDGTRNVDVEYLVRALQRMIPLGSESLLRTINHIFGCWQPFCLAGLDLYALLELPDDDLNDLQRPNSLLSVCELFHGSLLVSVAALLISQLVKEATETNIVDSNISAKIISYITKNVVKLACDGGDEQLTMALQDDISDTFCNLYQLFTHALAECDLRQSSKLHGSCSAEVSRLLSQMKNSNLVQPSATRRGKKKRR